MIWPTRFCLDVFRPTRSGFEDVQLRITPPVSLALPKSSPLGGLGGAKLLTSSRQVVTYPFIELRNSLSAKLNGRGVLIHNSRGSIVPLGIGAKGVEVAAKRSRCQLSNKIPKLVHSRCICDSRPDIVRFRNSIIEDEWEASCDNVSVLDCIVKHLLRCATAWEYIRMVAVNIKSSRVSDFDASVEIDESMEMNSSISVSFSCNETLSRKRRNNVVNSPFVEVSTLGVSEEDIAGLNAEAGLTHRC